ncbi:hypothetical protein EL75_4920 [Escherichia coli]|nr:hypothetical protein EL75_4920 [Escherichia coli]KGM76252.1 hypothetical protein EL79_5406 [Escherichia coli]KGM78229.1 hypothetical protein EL80_2914 [Escherichia coli]
MNQNALCPVNKAPAIVQAFFLSTGNQLFIEPVWTSSAN